MGVSAAVRRYMGLAIAPSTRRTYAPALANYASFCARTGRCPSPGALSPYAVAEWLAELGAEGRLRTATMDVYRSGLSTWWEEALVQGARNPTHAVVVQRTLAGIQRDRRVPEALARRARPVTMELTPSLLGELRPYALVTAGAAPQAIMRWAAANVGTYGLLRPSEFLSVYRNRAAAVTAAQVTFYAAAGSAQVRALLPTGAPLPPALLPDRFTLALGPTKADQQGANPPLVIAAHPAVAGLWRWMHVRRDLGGLPDGPVFQVPEERHLSCKELCSYVADWAQALHGGERPHVTGRTFRRGGASGLHGAGASRADTMQAGRWGTGAMVEVYSSARSKADRAARVSRGMAPTPHGAGRSAP